ncbi:hypothetical protein DP83_07175 [Vibrio metoecus]|uniref:Transposase IS66 central domain-containing protein n=1 Tax=Vibrio metoecus TaxID=1481663 RepID=A0ABR4RY71_VIBMT|nr:hypothetical protein DP83_07175 [Vibrio metoecus]
MKKLALYDNQNSRARSCPIAFLGNYDGYMQTDGYGAYDGFQRVTNVGCLAELCENSWKRINCKEKID